MDKLLLGPGVWRKTKASQADLLPEDIIVEILLRLPVKSLVRFRCVCKAWHSLLTTSEFSTLHRQHSRRQFYLIQVDESMKPGSDEDTYIGWDYRPIYKFALAPDDELDRLVHIDHPHLQSSSSGDHQIVNLRVIGSIDGLVCISVNFGTYIMIWNPSTRQSYQLPSPSFPESHETLGFGCSQNNGYKVVRIVFNTSSKSRKAEVYDSSTNLWHKTADPPNLSYSSTRCIIANGMPYWSSPYDSIIWFHPIHDTFGTVKLPVVLFELDSIYGNIIAGLGEIRGAVAVLVVELNQDGDMTMTIRGLDVWMMDRPHGDAGPISWTEQFRVEGVPRLWQWFTCWKDGELVFDTSESYEGRELCLYDYLRDETKTVPWIGSRLRAPDEIFLCKESLISPRPSP